MTGSPTGMDSILGSSLERSRSHAPAIPTAPPPERRPPPGGGHRVRPGLVSLPPRPLRDGLVRRLGRRPLVGHDPLGPRRPLAARQGGIPTGLTPAPGLVGCGPGAETPQSPAPAT